MRWKCYPLGDNDHKAKKQLLENLSMGAIEHTLSKKLLNRFSDATGPMVLIAFDSIDFDSDLLYAYATYNGGKGWFEAAGKRALPQEDCPIGGLVGFVKEYFRRSKDATVVCENWADTRKAYLKNWRPRESRVAFFLDEVYHILLSADASFNAIETAIRESTNQWATGVCCTCGSVPQGTIPSEAFFDVIVANTEHIFVPALDGDGYLIWSPEKNR
jgi:hypothetical protein